MAAWDSADLLSRLRYLIGRPTVDEALTDAQAYQLLADAQDRVNEDLAAHVPHLNYGAPELMTTSDGGYTYSTLYDIIGDAEIYPTLKAQPMRCGAFWDGSADYCLEGTKTIRMTVNRTRSFSAGPYARYVRADVPAISASQAPTIKPDRARALIVFRAAALWAARGGKRDPLPYETEYTRAAWGNPLTGSVGLIPTEKAKVFGQGSAAISDVPSAWWNSGDLG